MIPRNSGCSSCALAVVVASILVGMLMLACGAAVARAEGPVPAEVKTCSCQVAPLMAQDGWVLTRVHVYQQYGVAMCTFARPIPPETPDTVLGCLNQARGQVFKMLGTGAITDTVQVSLADFDELLTLIDAAQRAAERSEQGVLDDRP